MLAAEPRTRVDAGRLDRLRQAQAVWAGTEIEDRLRIAKRARRAMADRAMEFAGTVLRDPAETLTAEILPLCEACRFLEKNAARILAPVCPGNEGRPFWLHGVSLEIRREPVGVLLIIGPSNYPLFLPGVQMLQALIAGNGVIVKPGTNGSRSARLFADVLYESGLPQDLLLVLNEDAASAREAIEWGVDKVVLTGSFETGTAVLPLLAGSATPSVMELSGNDPLFVLEDGDPALALKAIDFAMTLNSGNTCIAPRRLFVWAPLAASFANRYPQLDVRDFRSEDEAIARAAESKFALGAAVFGSEARARAFAARLRAGVVVINDVIVPTADPRLPFGGRGHSGFGVTRGAEGLLEMTAIKAITVRRGRWRPHFDAKKPGDADLFSAFIGGVHGSEWKRLIGVAWDRLRRKQG